MYEVEKIVAIRNRKGKKQYEIKWKGYDHADNTWEPERNLVNAKQLLEEYEKTQKNTQSSKALRSGKGPAARYDHTQDHQDLEEDESANDSGRQNSTDKQFKSSKVKTPNVATRTRGNVGTTSKKQLRILAMSQTPDHQLVFKTMIDGDMKWVKRSFLVPEYLEQLVKFYESNLSFKN